MQKNMNMQQQKQMQLELDEVDGVDINLDGENFSKFKEAVVKTGVR